MRFLKYHGLGNDYLVLVPEGEQLSEQQVRLICHRNYGVGSDGILLPLPTTGGEFALRIFNPDGSEAEKSGNGLRIFCRYLYDTAQVETERFAIRTQGGLVRAQVRRGGKAVTVEMGQVSFDSQKIPMAGKRREALNEEIRLLGRTFRYCAATIGNPHCVILDAETSKKTICTLGPMIETDPRFPNRTNVQLLQVLDRRNIRIEIWERGAGYTLASGSSGSAAAAVAHRLGLCDNDIAVHMPGGALQIAIDRDFAITMTGPVTRICDGVLADEMLSQTLPSP